MSCKLYELGDYSPKDNSPQEMETPSQSFVQFDNQIGSHRYPWPRDPGPPPPFHGVSTAANMPEQNCLFHYAVVDECYQARFWGRALEYYLLENAQHNPPYRCLMATCPKRDFKDPREMLRHLKHCKLFPLGEFWCPTCHRNESFKVVSRKRCRWDKVNFAHKVFQKSKRVLQSITGSRMRLCPNCSCRIPPENSPYGGPLTPPELQMLPAEFDVQVNQANLARSMTSCWELGDTGALAEMPASTLRMDNAALVRLSCNVLPGQQTSDHQQSLSEPSSASSGTMSRTGNISDISPASPTYTYESRVTGFHLPGSMAMTTPPLHMTRQTNRRSQGPTLALDTRQSVVESPWGFMLDEGQTLVPSSEIGSLAMIDINPLAIVASEPNQNLPLHPYHQHQDSLVTPDNPYLHPSPSMSVLSFSQYELSPSSMSSGQGNELQCPQCDFKPTGKPESLHAYMRKHLQTHENTKIPCDHCEKTFTRQDNLTTHIRKVHSSPNELLSKRRRGSSESSQSSSQPRRKEYRRDEDMLLG